MLSLLISSAVVLIVPKLLGVESYGYFQLYLFYSSYIGFFHLGWSDGIYLELGGENYNKLNKKLYFSQFWMLVGFQAVLMLILLGLASLATEPDKIFIYNATAACMLITNVRMVLVHILQATNRIKEYAISTILDRLFYFILILSLVYFKISNYRFIIIADLFGRTLSLFYTVLVNKSIVFRKSSDFSLQIKAAFYNINSGIKLMLANIASALIIGIVRFFIEKKWSIEVFGKISLTLSVSNLIMVFINAVSVIMFPMLRRAEKKSLPSLYLNIRNVLMVFLFGILVLYFPFSELLISWLPHYKDGLVYMGILFPICIYEGKTSLLINTYLKTLRKEKIIMNINIVTVILSTVLAYLSIYVLNSLTLSIVSIVFVLGFRCILSELIVSYYLDFTVWKDVILETMIVVIFILLAWFSSIKLGVFFYIIIFLVYILIKRKELTNSISQLRKLMLERN